MTTSILGYLYAILTFYRHIYMLKVKITYKKGNPIYFIIHLFGNFVIK